MANEWKQRGDVYIKGDVNDAGYMSKVRKLAKAKAQRLGRPVQIDFRNVDSTGRGFRAPIEIVNP